MRLERDCPICGTHFSVQASAPKFGWGKTCSVKCGHALRSATAAARTEKKCRRCGERKPVGQFYKQSMGRAGYSSWCKSCSNTFTREWEARNPEKATVQKKKAWKKWAESNPDKYKQSVKKGVSKFRASHPERYKEMVRRHDERRRLAHPEKIAAKQAVRVAIQSGQLVRYPCEICGAPKTHGHHDDYSKPLIVRWLCAKHHAEHHRHQRGH